MDVMTDIDWTITGEYPHNVIEETRYSGFRAKEMKNEDLEGCEEVYLEHFMESAMEDGDVDKVEELRKQYSAMDSVIWDKFPHYLWMAFLHNRLDVVDDLLETFPDIVEQSVANHQSPTPERAFLKTPTLAAKKRILELYPQIKLPHDHLFIIEMDKQEYKKLISWLDSIDPDIAKTLIPVLSMNFLNTEFIVPLCEYDKKHFNVLEGIADGIFSMACRASPLSVCKYLYEAFPGMNLYSTATLTDKIPEGLQHMKNFYLMYISALEPLEKVKWFYSVDEKTRNDLQDTKTVELLLVQENPIILKDGVVELHIQAHFLKPVWLLSINPEANIHVDDDCLFEHFCKGNKEGMEWVYNHSPVEKHLHHFFEVCCRYDFVDGAAWLVEKHSEILDPTYVADPDPPDMKRVGLNGRFFCPGREISYKGVCKSRSINDLFMACLKSYKMRIVEWLSTLGVITLFRDNPSAFKDICIDYISLEKLKWLLKTFPEIDVRANDYEAFYACCARGGISIMDLLYSLHPEVDLRINDDYYFRRAFYLRDFQTYMWFVPKESAYEIQKDEFDEEKAFINGVPVTERVPNFLSF